MCQGTVMGPIRDILIEHIRARSAYTFVRLLSTTHAIENIHCEGCRGRLPSLRDQLEPLALSPGGGRIHNVVLRDFAVHKMATRSISATHKRRFRSCKEQFPLIQIQSAVQNLRIENFHRDAVKQPSAPTLSVENGQENLFAWRALDGDQERALGAASPGISPDEFSSALPGGGGTGPTIRVLAFAVPG